MKPNELQPVLALVEVGDTVIVKTPIGRRSLATVTARTASVITTDAGRFHADTGVLVKARLAIERRRILPATPAEVDDVDAENLAEHLSQGYGVGCWKRLGLAELRRIKAKLDATLPKETPDGPDEDEADEGQGRAVHAVPDGRRDPGGHSNEAVAGDGPDTAA